MLLSNQIFRTWIAGSRMGWNGNGCGSGLLGDNIQQIRCILQTEQHSLFGFMLLHLHGKCICILVSCRLVLGLWNTRWQLYNIMYASVPSGVWKYLLIDVASNGNIQQSKNLSPIFMYTILITKISSFHTSCNNTYSISASFFVQCLAFLWTPLPQQ